MTNIGKIALNRLKNSWKILPIGSFMNYLNHEPKLDISKKEPFNETLSILMKRSLHAIYAVSVPVFLLTYISIGVSNGVWDPTQYKESYRKKLLKEKLEEQHQTEIYQKYQEAITSNPTKQDSVEFYLENGLEKYVILKNIPTEEKEMIVNKQK